MDQRASAGVGRRLWRAGAIVCLALLASAGCGGGSSGTGSSGGGASGGEGASDGGNGEQLITAEELKQITGDDYLDGNYAVTNVFPGNSRNDQACTTKYEPQISCLFSTEAPDPTYARSAFEVRVWCGTDGLGHEVEVSKEVFSSEGSAEAVPGLGSEAYFNNELVPQLGWKNGSNVCEAQVPSETTTREVTDPKAFVIAVAKIVDARMDGNSPDGLVKPIGRIPKAS